MLTTVLRAQTQAQPEGFAKRGLVCIWEGKKEEKERKQTLLLSAPDSLRCLCALGPLPSLLFCLRPHSKLVQGLEGSFRGKEV